MINKFKNLWKTFKKYFLDEQVKHPIDKWDENVARSEELQSDLDIIESINNNDAETLIVDGAARDILFKIAESGGPAVADFIDKLDDAGLLDKFLPEIKAMQGVPHHPEHHPEGDVGQHVQAALRVSPISGKPITTLAILFHDIGKPGTYALILTDKYPEGKHTFHDHAKFGVGVFQKIANRLKFSTDEKQVISFIIRNHMRPYKAAEMEPNKLLALKNSPYWDKIQDVLYADIHSRGTGKRLGISGTQYYEDILQHFNNL